MFDVNGMLSDCGFSKEEYWLTYPKEGGVSVRYDFNAHFSNINENYTDLDVTFYIGEKPIGMPFHFHKFDLSKIWS